MKVIVVGFLFFVFLYKDVNSAEISVLDKTQGLISNTLISTVDWFDDFFSNDKVLDEEPCKSSIRVQNVFRIEERNTINSRQFFHVNIKPRKINKRLRFIIRGESSDDPLDPLEQDEIAQDITNSGLERYLILGSRYNFIYTDTTKLSLGSGMNFDWPLDPYAKLKFRRKIPLSIKYHLYFAQTVLWKESSAWRETTELELSYLLSSDLMFQLTNVCSFTDSVDSFDWGSRFDIMYKYSMKTALSYNMGLSGLTEALSKVNNYYISLKYRHKLYKNWFYVEIEPEKIWLRDTYGDYLSDIALSLRFEIHFGNVINEKN